MPHIVSNLLDVYGCEEQLLLGSKFAPSGAIILLFDCSVEAAYGELGGRSPPPYTSINSPILSSFKAAIEESDDIEVIVIQYPKGPILRMKTPLFGAHGKKRKHALKSLNSKPFKQLKTGYRRLAESYRIDSDKSTRKSVLIFGVKEGAIAANALVEMIRMTGILMRQFCPRGNNGLFEKYFQEVYNVATTTTGPDSNECKNLVDLLGLWYNKVDGNQKLRAVRGQKPHVGTVVVEGLTPCASCMRYSCGKYCPLRHMIETVSKTCEENKISVYLNSNYIASEIDIQSTNG
ncbi:uncharacterized protein FOMMEDRAFT_28858 [Fomitiporia mediterranea MF3/22]|uniref:uncharacterized protein n=1 Tax=Fomitiporia mediterranea (strain MF3/22) TaxID=694068 RepID=UPI0004408EE2|nr:uncharacterized protein FOMMEDRAFT_28858 [Fomitiporia mediterranea MF3/22]EJD03350.1 hypothetical protein FOMMEDRAFT_28858 [Fomitiporia mediterranea MF3/22]